MEPVPPLRMADVVVATPRDLDAALGRMARAQRMVFVAGLPGVGKSLFIRELARAAHAAGRTVHLLQWDVVRPAFVSPEVDARYPEKDGVTHAVIRKAVGLWSRGAVLRWHAEHPDVRHMLIGEVPIIGNRLLELAQAQEDEAESLLAGEGALFITPVPSVAVRAAIARARGQTFSNPTHPRESADAPPALMDAAWDEVHALAAAIGAAPPVDGPAPFDPSAYATVYRHLLRHRHALTLWVNVQLEQRASVYDLNMTAHELVPAPGEAAAILARLERESPVDQIERDVASWFERV